MTPPTPFNLDAEGGYYHRPAPDPDAATAVGTPTMKDRIMGCIETIEAVYESRGKTKTTGLGTGLAGLDRLTDGLHPGELTVFAALPGVGTTALGLNVAEHVALNEKKPVLIFSPHTGAVRLTQRLLCSRARIDLQKVRDGFLTGRDFPHPDGRRVRSGRKPPLH